MEICFYKDNSFLPIIIYKVLKRMGSVEQPTRRFLTHHNLQGSQTIYRHKNK